VVQVVSLDWKWLFIYPEQGIATVNELALPVDRRCGSTDFDQHDEHLLRADAGRHDLHDARDAQQLHAVLNKPGVYDGMSANYSGAGFSDMRFKLRGVMQAGSTPGSRG
jgi:cytochrome o ubiquinol oxidase subunit 2